MKTLAVRVAGTEGMKKSVIDEPSKKVRMIAVYGTTTAQLRRSLEKCDELIAFCEKHDRLPSDRNQAEKHLRTFYLKIFSPDTSPRVKVILEDVRRRWGKNAKTLKYWKQQLNEILSYCEKHSHLPSTYKNPSLNTILQRINKGELPEGVQDELADIIKYVKGCPRAKNLKNTNLEDRVVQIEGWVNKYMKLPSLADVRNGKITRSLYNLFGRRNHMARKDITKRLNALVHQHSGVNGAVRRAGLKSKTSRTEEIEIVRKRNVKKLKELADWIRKKGSLPTPGENKVLHSFSVLRYSRVLPRLHGHIH